MFVLDVCKAFEKEKIPYAIVGGFAVALHGAVRGTVDLDLIVSLSPDVFLRAEKALKTLRLESRLPIDGKMVGDFREEYISKKNLIAWSFLNPKDPSQLVDLLLTHDLKKMKAIKMKFHGIEISVLAKDDLIRMKKKSGRPQDLEDAKALERIP